MRLFRRRERRDPEVAKQLESVGDELRALRSIVRSIDSSGGTEPEWDGWSAEEHEREVSRLHDLMEDLIDHVEGTRELTDWELRALRRDVHQVLGSYAVRPI